VFGKSEVVAVGKGDPCTKFYRTCEGFVGKITHRDVLGEVEEHTKTIDLFLK
jgi:hypothetical protein